MISWSRSRFPSLLVMLIASQGTSSPSLTSAKRARGHLTAFLRGGTWLGSVDTTCRLPPLYLPSPEPRDIHRLPAVDEPAAEGEAAVGRPPIDHGEEVDLGGPGHRALPGFARADQGAAVETRAEMVEERGVVRLDQLGELHRRLGEDGAVGVPGPEPAN